MNVSMITTVGIVCIILYSIVTILNLYGFKLSDYGIYLSFYVFLFISSFILPRQSPNFD